jgi:hypothetical protein
LTQKKPFFYGSRAAHFVTNAVSNGDAINAAIGAKLGRTIETLLSKTNRQFRSYRSRHPRKNSVSICVILNSTLREWSPDVVVRAIHGKMKISGDGEPRFPSIDAVLYVSEKHIRKLSDGRPAHGLVIYEGSGALNHPWKMLFVDYIVDAWSRARTGSPVLESEDRNFETVEDIPESMRGSEVWQLEYRRVPYLQALSVERLRAMFHRTIAVNSLSFLKGAWPKPPAPEISKGMRIFTHIIEETNRRGLDIRLLDERLLTAEEKVQVFLGLPEELVNILSSEARGSSR